MKRCIRIALVLLIALMAMTALVLIGEAQSSTLRLQAQALILPDITDVITESGGMLVSPNGQVTVTFDGVTEPVTITLSFNVPQTMPTRLNLIGSVFAIGARDLSNTPMTLTVQYVSSVGINENGLTIAYHDEIAGRWLPLPTAIDTVRHMATASANQLTRYALVWLAVIQPPPGSVAVVDDLEAGFAKHGAAAGWHSVTNSTTYSYLGHMYWTSNTYSTEDNWATWTPSLVTGDYQVLVFVPWWNTTTEKARYQIVHNGQTTVYTVSQKQYYAAWVNVGTYSFGNDPANNYMRLGDVTGETHLTKYIGFDAVAFVQNKVYLPLVLKEYPPQPIKAKSGIHLGNRPLADWNVSTGGSYDFLFRLRGNTTNGIWPGAVVIQSQQVYTIERSPDGQCPITEAKVRSPFVYEFLKEAARRGTRVIIRISPSPGNFEDAMETTPPHRIIADSGVTPHGQPYCYDPIPGDNKYTAADYFRSIDDVAAEMNAIHTLNASFNIPDFEFGFSPANEPNNEWYPPGSKVAINTDIAWQDMDAYFTALYDYVHQHYPGIRVFTPPMAQGNYAETMRIGAGCVPMTVTVSGQSGYTFMTNTLTTKNDGYTWHNYWHVGKEMWQDCPSGEHIFRYFPDWLRTQIRDSSKPRFILEADLLSPCQDPGVTLSNKDVDITTVASSLRQFITEEQRADYTIVWLLTESPHFEGVCVAGQTEIQWHEAYREDGTERPWFANWWLETETWP